MPHEEKLLMRFRQARLYYFWYYVLFSIILLVTIVIYFDIYTLPQSLGFRKTDVAVLPVIVIIGIGILEIKNYAALFYLTDYRILERRGIFNIKEYYMTWDKISNCTIKQNILERIFNLGKIELWSVGGTDSPEITLDCIGNVKDIKEMVDGLLLKKH